MNILILGATGFVGRHAADALVAAGHAVRRAGRREFDFARIAAPVDWGRALDGVDVVVNAIGIFRERAPAATFEAIHTRGPIALFEACAQSGARVIQISALGADENAASRFHRSKKAADDALLGLRIPAVVVQPSLVFGIDGASARMFTMLASLPLIPLPGTGMQRIQPVHVDDVAAAIVGIVERMQFDRTRIPLVGPEPTTLREYLGALRRALGLGRPVFIAMPMPLMQGAARLSIGLLDTEALAMLERGNTGDSSRITALLGRAPRPPSQFIASPTRHPARVAAQLMWIAPVLRIAIAIVWLTAGVVSAGLYPVDESLALLARTGITGTAAYAALYGAAALDFALGIATLVMRRRRWLWLAQAAVIVAYTTIITVFLPEQWLHPYGPVVKNLPMLAAILLLHQLERR